MHKSSQQAAAGEAVGDFGGNNDQAPSLSLCASSLLAACSLTRGIVALVDREADLLNRWAVAGFCLCCQCLSVPCRHAWVCTAHTASAWQQPASRAAAADAPPLCHAVQGARPSIHGGAQDAAGKFVPAVCAERAIQPAGGSRQASGCQAAPPAASAPLYREERPRGRAAGGCLAADAGRQHGGSTDFHCCSVTS